MLHTSRIDYYTHDKLYVLLWLPLSRVMNLFHNTNFCTIKCLVSVGHKHD